MAERGLVGHWSHDEAASKQIEQIASSGCGVTAILTVTTLLSLRFDADEVLDKSVLRRRDEQAALPQYLASRSVAGCSGEEIAASLQRLAAARLASDFLPTASIVAVGAEDGPARLLRWLAEQLRAGRCVIATLNLQLYGNDAWHHQFVYAVDEAAATVHCTNPLCAYSADQLLQLTTTPSVLLVRNADVLSRAARPGGDTSVYQRPDWRRLDVAGQVDAVIAGRSTSPFVVIPAIYTGGFTVCTPLSNN